MTSRTAAASQPALASLGDRLLGQIFDGLVVVVPFALAGIAMAITDSRVPVLLPVAAAVGLFYLWFSDGFRNGQSWGKRAMNTAVIDSDDGAPCTFGQSFVRNFLLSVLGPIDWIFIFGETRRRLGDRAAGTKVISLDR